MGTVHAKSVEPPSSRDGLFEFDDASEMDEQPISKPTIRLNGVRARVDRVHVDGLKRTKDDIVRLAVDDLFHATDFEDVILRAHKVRRTLDNLGCFRDIGVFIDVSSGPGATPEGLEVTFQVNELSRVVGGVNTMVSENEGNLVVGMKLPNVWGRGERVSAEYSLGHRSSSNFSVTAAKPLPHRHLQPTISASVYQQNQEYPWSGYKLLDRGLLLDAAFKTSPATSHNVQWEGLVRDMSVLSKTTSFKVRESSGPQMKSILRHIVTIDHRDEPIFPTRGTYVQFTSEVCGLGGGVAYLKNELKAQHNTPITEDVVFQLGVALGALHSAFGAGPAERLYAGGPTSVRGFAPRGLGPRADSLAAGGALYWAGAAHVFAPLPFVRGGALGGLARSHAFVTGGWVGGDARQAAAGARAAAGLGLALRLGRAARLELNYVLPLRAEPHDRMQAPLQFGIGAYFL